MTKAFESYKRAISDVNELRDRIDLENAETSGGAPEYLKRSALTMVTTAWETYIEDLFYALVTQCTHDNSGSVLTRFFRQRAEAELKMLHNPSKQKVQQLFRDYFDFDVTEEWKWANYQDPKEVGKRLQEWLSLRGDVVHRSANDEPGHAVSTNDLRKCVNFFDGLVAATESAISEKFVI